MSEEFEIENFEDLMNVFENTGDFGEYYLGDYSNIQIANYLRKMQQENKQLKEKINKVSTRIKTIINIIKEQPTDNIHTDMYIIEALNSLLHILKEEENEKTI